jgi:hypothetical protein
MISDLGEYIRQVDAFFEYKVSTLLIVLNLSADSFGITC